MPILAKFQLDNPSHMLKVRILPSGNLQTVIIIENLYSICTHYIITSTFLEEY